MRTHSLGKVAKRGSVDVGSKRNTGADRRGIYVTFIGYFWLVSLAYIVSFVHPVQNLLFWANPNVGGKTRFEKGAGCVRPAAYLKKSKYTEEEGRFFFCLVATPTFSIPLLPLASEFLPSPTDPPSPPFLGGGLIDDSISPSCCDREVRRRGGEGVAATSRIARS